MLPLLNTMLARERAKGLRPQEQELCVRLTFMVVMKAKKTSST